MIIQRDQYLKKLITGMHNGSVKVITGIRGCGKSFLLSHIFKDYLLSNGVQEDHIIDFALDEREFQQLRYPSTLSEYVRARLTDSGAYYVFLHEAQLSHIVPIPGVDLTVIPEEDRYLAYLSIYEVLNGLLSRPNLDLYITASDTRMLANGVPADFWDRCSEIRMFPLRFLEFYPLSGLDKTDAWAQYFQWGGLPLAVLEPDEMKRARYLSGLIECVDAKGLAGRCGVEGEYLRNVFDAVSAAVGAWTTPNSLAKTQSAASPTPITDERGKKALAELENAFLIQKARRFDLNTKVLKDTPVKYYATDVGLRNARLGFQHMDEAVLMENILFNELRARGYAVDAGLIQYQESVGGKRTRRRYDVDFAVNLGRKMVYIQCVPSVSDPEVRMREIKPMMRCRDAFPRIVVTAGNERLHIDDKGICTIGIIPFLLDEGILEK